MTECAIEGCKQEHNYLMSVYCSSECWNLAMRLSFERMEARLSDTEPPEMDDLLNRRQRAKRWTPNTMDKHITSIKRGVDATYSNQ